MEFDKDLEEVVKEKKEALNIRLKSMPRLFTPTDLKRLLEEAHFLRIEIKKIGKALKIHWMLV